MMTSNKHEIGLGSLIIQTCDKDSNFEIRPKIILQEMITDDEQKDQMLRLFSDKYIRKIIQKTQTRPVSALYLHKEYNIPKSATHRKLRLLRNLNMLKVSGKIDKNGKKTLQY